MKNLRLTGFIVEVWSIWCPRPTPVVAGQVRPMHRCIYCGGSRSLYSVWTRRNATEKRGMCACKKRCVKYSLMSPGLLCVLIIVNTGVLISPQPDLLPDVFCLMVRIFRLMLVLLCINSTNIPPIMIINRIYETQNLLSL